MLWSSNNTGEFFIQAEVLRKFGICTLWEVVNGPYLDEFLDFAHVRILKSHLRDISFTMQVSEFDSEL